MHGIIARILAASALAIGWLAPAAWAAETTAPEGGGLASPRIAKPNDGVLDLYFIGKRQSSIEPCGCHTKQRGGVQYEASLYDQHPGRPSIRVDAGAWTSLQASLTPIDALYTRYLLLAMRALDLDAINVSALDLKLGKKTFDNLEKEHPGTLQALISANVYDAKKPDRLAFPPYRVVERSLANGRKIKIGLVGVTSPDWTGDRSTQLTVDEYVVKPLLPALQAVVAELRPKVDLLVVLDAEINTNEVMALPESVPGIDAIVTTTALADPGAQVMRNGRTYLFRVINTQGKELGIASFKPSPMTGGWMLAGMAESLYVSVDLPPAAPLQKIVNDFKAKTADLDVDLPGAGVKRVYAGSDACNSCHSAIVDSWEKTLHKQAMKTLVDVGQQYNPACVKCHVTGYRHENGFYSIKHPLSMEMSNVQCEACHGPAAEHVDLEQQIVAKAQRWMTPAQYQDLVAKARKAIPPAKVPASTCIQCHQGDNDPNFNYDLKVPKVNHGEVPAKARLIPAALRVTTDAAKK